MSNQVRINSILHQDNNPLNIPPFLYDRTKAGEQEKKERNIELVRALQTEAIQTYCELHELNPIEFMQNFENVTAVPQPPGTIIDLGNLLCDGLYEAGISGRKAQTALSDYYQSMSSIRKQLKRHSNNGNAETEFHHSQNNIDAVILSAMGIATISDLGSTNPQPSL